MATQAHCAYCFESLSASLEKRAPLSLRQVESLWEQYNADPSETEATPAGGEEAEHSDSEMEDAPAPATAGSSYRPAAISRILAPSPSTASSSSVQSTISTPSGVSEASSAASKSSSRSSFFGLGKMLRKEKERREVADSPLFVTWNVLQKHGEKRLRGCIGTFEPQELDDGLGNYALTSYVLVLHDPIEKPRD